MAAGSQLIGGGIAGLGALYNGQTTSQSLNLQADENTNNATLATEQGQYNSMRAQMLANQKIGATTAAYGANGISADSGSVLSVLTAGASNAELDSQNIIQGAKVKAINYENEASLERLGAGNAVTASYLNALSSVLGGSAKAFGSGAGSTGGEDLSLDDAGGEDATADMAGGDEMAAAAAV